MDVRTLALVIAIILVTVLVAACVKLHVKLWDMDLTHVQCVRAHVHVHAVQLVRVTALDHVI